MRPCRNLASLEISTKKRLNKLRNIITDSLPLPTRHREAQVAYSVIEILNTWTNFSRSFYLSCVLWPKSTKGNRISINTRGLSFDQAIDRAVVFSYPNRRRPTNGIWHRRDEPTWHDYSVLLNVCTNLGCSNIATIRVAFSLGSRVFLDLPVFRNFFAHRNRNTEYAARQLALQHTLPTSQRPSQILLFRPPTRHQSLIFEWIDDLTTTVELLCE